MIFGEEVDLILIWRGHPRGQGAREVLVVNIVFSHTLAFFENLKGFMI